MLYLPKKTYKEISSLDLRYTALSRELAFQSREFNNLREQVASFDSNESEIAKTKFKKIVLTITVC